MRCLVVQTAYLGDVILTVPLLSLLRASDAVTATRVVTTPVGAEFLRGQDVTDDVEVYDKRGADRGPRGFARALSAARSWGPDAALVPHRSFRSALLARCSGARRRIGFDESGGRTLLTERVPYRSAAHEIERVAALAGPLGVFAPHAGPPFELRVPEDAEASLDRRLRASGVPPEPPILVAPGSRWPTKRWPAERFARAALELSAAFGGPVVLAGGEGDREACDRTREAAARPVFDLCGTLSVSEWIALVARARVLLANDSAAGHVAAGVGTPVVSVFGPTVPEQGFAPYSDASRIASADLDCRPCGRHGGLRCGRGDLACMERVAVEDVVSKARELLSD